MSDLGNKKVVKTVKKQQAPARQIFRHGKWFKLFLKSRHGAKEDRRKASNC